jgi:PEP-CTERM motif
LLAGLQKDFFSMNNIFSRFILAGVIACSLATTAGAATVYTLNVDGCTGTCGTGPYGTVQLDQNGVNDVKVTVTLAAGENFAGTGAGEALEFNIAGNTIPSFSNISSGFTAGPAPATASTFGTFEYSITCSVCQGGNGPVGPLSFDVLGTGLTEASFTANNKGFYFASDIAAAVGRNVNTGNVGANGPDTPSGVPEPASMALFSAGLIGIVAARRKLHV